MFLRNLTPFDVSLARGHASDEVAVAAVIVSRALRIEDPRLSPSPRPAPSDPELPDTTRFPLWDGVSVTVSGTARGPAKAPHVTPVLLRIGSAERRLIVFGERRWERRFGGALTASAALPFDGIELSFQRAFGGAYDLPPGLLPGTDLPHPGLRVAYPQNDRGIGYYPDERAATGAPLPFIERPDQLVKRWNDTPEPAGFTPCRDLVHWRMSHDPMVTGARDGAPDDGVAPPATWTPPLRIYHHAPPSLIFRELPTATPISLEGLGPGPLRFTVPAAPCRVAARTRHADTQIEPRLRALHVDADRGVLHAVHDHTFRYDPRRSPTWIRVEAASGKAS